MKARSDVRTESARYFETQAETYGARYDEPSPAGHALRERRGIVVAQLGRSGGDVLDVGCGPAVMGSELVDAGWRFYGVDASPAVARAAGERCSGLSSAHVAAGALPRLPFPDGRFDAVLCIGVIDRLPDADEVLAELGRVLRPGGTLLVSFPNAMSPAARWRNNVFLPVVRLLKRLLRALGLVVSSEPDLTRSVPLWMARRAAMAVDRHIGPVAEIKHFHYAVLPAPLEQVFPRLSLRLAKRVERLAAGRLRWLGIGFIVKATRTSHVDEGEKR